ncbi:MAG: transcriptional regulator GcvA [Pseudomonadota bacterium]
MHGRLPPLTALRAFEAAARHLSFAKAAEELHVTPAALSYQIRVLEEHLATSLFNRLNRAVTLTEAGKALAPRAANAFATLAEGVRAVERLSDSSLTVTAGPAFTAKWLAPRFFRFASAHPDIELRFVASLRLMDFDRDGIDAAIRFGIIGDSPSVYSEVLIDEFVVPVVSPEIAETIKTPEDLARAPLFHDDSVAHLMPDLGWPAWFRIAGLGERPEAARGPRFSNADHAIDGAAEGGGVALARGSLAERDIAQGRLVVPIPIGITIPGRFRFVCKSGAERDPRIATFLDWLREEVTDIATLARRIDLRPMPE